MLVFKSTPCKVLSISTVYGGSPSTPPLISLTFALPTSSATTSSLHSLGFDLGLGDFLRLSLPLKPARAYSPISHPLEKGIFVLVVRVYEDGKLSPFLSELKVGDMAYVKGPLPVPWLTKKRERASNIAIVAFGVGMTEVVNVVRSELKDEITKVVRVLWCLREEDEGEAFGKVINCGDGDERVEVIISYSAVDGRIDGGRIKEVFGEMNKGDTAVLAVGRKKSERQVYEWFKKAGYNRRLLKIGIRWCGRDHSPLRGDCEAEAEAEAIGNQNVS